uniref:Uncharacterized protein n=1 Tax=Solanum lycopersicum TaxID=4081 RepID=K4CMS3_SOLLC
MKSQGLDQAISRNIFIIRVDIHFRTDVLTPSVI